MTAEPVPEREQPPGVPEWLIPSEEGFTAEDLDRLPELPAHTELIDGSLIIVSPQVRFHMLMLRLLEHTLLRLVPPDLEIVREMTVTLGKRQRPEPDLMVVRAESDQGLDQSTYRAEDVVLVVEVTSNESQERDRNRKPQLYAEAGIPHFWRVENAAFHPTVYVYELDPATDAYSLTGIHHDRLKLSVPFDLDIDLTEINRRRR